MPAPRRIGKTWTLNRLAADLRADGWHVIELDVEGVATADAFARQLCLRIEAEATVRERFRAHLGQRITNLLGGDWGDKPLDALGRVEPVGFAETLVAALDDSQAKTAILVDEISYFFLALAQKDPEGARHFAYRLRALVQRHRNVRWLITGSIGLDTIARRFNLQGAFVDFETFILEPFTKAEARSYMRDPAIQQQINRLFDASDADFDTMFTELGWLAPFYLRLVANEVHPSIPPAPGHGPLATALDFEAAFDRLLQPNRQSEFAVWREHVNKNLPTADQAVARAILATLSRTPQGETEPTLLAGLPGGGSRRQLNDILAMLLSDGLLGFAAGRYAFRSGLVRRFWQAFEAD